MYPNGTSRLDGMQSANSIRGAEQESPASRWLRWSMEAVTLCMVIGSPWAFGCADPPFEFYLHVGVGLLAVLWGLRSIARGGLQWQSSPVAFSLIALFALGLYQLVPLPRGLLHFIAPASSGLVEQLLPDQQEELPYDLKPDANLRASNQTISVYPAATRYALFRSDFYT
jgi:hypothetical protein